MKSKSYKIGWIIGAMLLTINSSASAYGFIWPDNLHCMQRPNHIDIEWRNNLRGKPDCYAINRNSGMPASLVNTVFWNALPAYGIPATCMTIIQANPGCEGVGQKNIDAMTKYRGTDSTTQY